MNMTKRLLLLARKHWGTLAIAAAGLVGAAVLNLVTPEMVRMLTARLENGEMTVSMLWIFGGLALCIRADADYLR